MLFCQIQAHGSILDSICNNDPNNSLIRIQQQSQIRVPNRRSCSNWQKCCFMIFFVLRYSLYNATPQYTVSHFTVIVHIAKFWQLIGAVPWYGSDLGYSYSLWLLGDVPVIHGVALLPALQAFLLQDSFLQPLHLNSRLKKGRKERKKCCQQAKDEGCCAAPHSSHFRPTSKLHSSNFSSPLNRFSHHS